MCQHYGTLLLLCHCATMWEKRVLSFTPSFMCWGSIILHWSSFRCVCQINWLLLFVTEKICHLPCLTPPTPTIPLLCFPGMLWVLWAPSLCRKPLVFFFSFCVCVMEGVTMWVRSRCTEGGGRGGPRSLLRPLNCVRNVCWSLATLKGPALPPPSPPLPHLGPSKSPQNLYEGGGAGADMSDSVDRITV